MINHWNFGLQSGKQIFASEVWQGFFQGLTHSPRFFAHPGADFYTLYTKHIRDLREEISGVDGTWKIYENYSGWWFEPS